MTPTPLVCQAKTNCRRTSVPQDCDRTFSVILHCEGHYTGPVTTEISSHFLPQVFFLAFCVPLHGYEPYISGIFCMSLILEHRFAKQFGTLDHLIQSPATFLQDRMISVLADIFHTTRSCAGVSKSYVRRRRCLTDGDVATTGAQLLAQVMVSDVGRRA